MMGKVHSDRPPARGGHPSLFGHIGMERIKPVLTCSCSFAELERQRVGVDFSPVGNGKGSRLEGMRGRRTIIVEPCTAQAPTPTFKTSKHGASRWTPPSARKTVGWRWLVFIGFKRAKIRSDRRPRMTSCCRTRLHVRREPSTSGTVASTWGLPTQEFCRSTVRPQEPAPLNWILRVTRLTYPWDS